MMTRSRTRYSSCSVRATAYDPDSRLPMEYTISSSLRDGLLPGDDAIDDYRAAGADPEEEYFDGSPSWAVYGIPAGATIGGHRVSYECGTKPIHGSYLTSHLVSVLLQWEEDIEEDTMTADEILSAQELEIGTASRAMVRRVYAAAEDGGTIQAQDMVDLVGDPRLHTATDLRRALLAIGCREVTR